MLKNIIILLLSATIFGCQSTIEIDIPEEPSKIVVNSFFGTDTTWEVHISKSEYVLSAQGNALLPAANVTVTGSDGSMIPLTHTNDGYFSNTSYRPQKGIVYRIKVSNKGMEEVEAVSQIPSQIQIVKIDTSTLIKSDQGGYVGVYKQVAIQFYDNPTERNFYSLEVEGLMMNYIYEWDTLGNFFISDSSLSKSPMYYQTDDKLFEESFGAERIFEDNTINGKLYTLKILLPEYYFNPLYGANYYSIYFNLKNVSEDYGKYIKSYNKYLSTNGDPFSEPVKVYTNINKGYGIFAGYSVSTDSLKLK